MSKESQIDYSSELTPKLIEEINKVAASKKLNAAQKEKLKAEVVRMHQDSRFAPGDVIGILAAQSISEPATQMTMRTYHSAGSAGIKVTYGLPRLIEIFDAKKDPETPMMTVLLKSAYNSSEGARKFAEDIVEKHIDNVADKVSINLNDSSIDIDLLDVRKQNRVVDIINENIKGDVAAKKAGNKIKVVAKGEVDVKELSKIKEKVLGFHVDGIKGVSNAVVRKEENDWVINTIGTNLEEILSRKEVNPNRTITNDIQEIAKILGIEAARNMIIDESMRTMQEQGLDVDVRHIMLLGDTITFRGNIMSIGRYGLAGAKSSVLSRAAFEETIKHLVRASIKNESDSFQGIFENVMIGQVIPSGTGMFDLIARFGEDEEDKKVEKKTKSKADE